MIWGFSCDKSLSRAGASFLHDVWLTPTATLIHSLELVRQVISLLTLHILVWAGVGMSAFCFAVDMYLLLLVL